jgi:hypothetical protein
MKNKLDFPDDLISILVHRKEEGEGEDCVEHFNRSETWFIWWRPRVHKMVPETMRVVTCWRHCGVPVLEQWRSARVRPVLPQLKPKSTALLRCAAFRSQGNHFVKLVGAVSWCVCDGLHRAINWCVSNDCLSSTNVNTISHDICQRGSIIPEKNSVACVRKRTIPTERPLLVGEVSANFCG